VTALEHPSLRKSQTGAIDVIQAPSASHKYASRKDFPPSDILDLDSSVLADSFEEELARFYKSGPTIRPLLIDFRNAAFIDIAALVNCISVLLDRRENGLLTKIGLPARKPVLDFLRVWQFFEAVEQATQKPFETWVLESDRILSQTPQATYTGVGSALDLLEYDPDWTH
jgi:hypothetical protein